MRSFAPLLVVVATTVITSVVAQFDDGYQNVTSATTPVQIRLAYQGPSAMMVSWNTFSQLANPTVRYGLSPNALSQSASSSVSITYPTSLTYNNHVNISGLLPFTKYYYLPYDPNVTATPGTPYSFTTARLAGDSTPYTMGVVVDMGTFGALGLSTVVGTGAANPLRVNEQTTIASLEEMRDSYEFMVHAGDIAYADYWLKEEIQNYLPTTTLEQGAVVYESILNAFFDELINITSVKPYMVNAGNHEANCDNGGTTNKTSGVAYTAAICSPGQTNFTGYINHWRMPSGPSGGVGNFWYSYDYGMTHFVHIDTETDLGNGLVGPDEGSPEFGGPFGSANQQINWLTKDLASVNRTVTPWIVIFGHRGWYLSSASACPTCQTAFENIFQTYGVDLYISGHAHIYERTAPVYQNVIDPNGLNNPNATMYVTNGAAGHYDGLDVFTAIQNYSVARTNADYAWTTLSFINRTHMTINTLWSANNTIFDTATLYKAHAKAVSSSPTSSSTGTISATSTSSASSATASYTSFNGAGHLYVYYQGVLTGDVGSADTWYNTPGQNTATFTAVPVNKDGSQFTLQHSTDYCTIDSVAKFFNCTASTAGAATVFGQTSDGNLTYNGVEAFYASSAASANARPTIYATPLPVSINIGWGLTDLIIIAPTTTSAAGSSSTVVPSTTGSSGSSVASTTASPSSSRASSASSTSATVASSATGSLATSASSTAASSATSLPSSKVSSMSSVISTADPPLQTRRPCNARPPVTQ